MMQLLTLLKNAENESRVAQPRVHDVNGITSLDVVFDALEREIFNGMVERISFESAGMSVEDLAV